MTPPDPLHQPGGPETFWTTINAEENLAGVVDPLSGSFWVAPVTLGTLGAFADMGVIPERQVVFGPDPDEHITGLIAGRYCVNVDRVRLYADLMPGTSGDAMERDLFGHAREGIPSHRSLKRYPIVALKAPGAAMRVTGRINRAYPQSQAWWRRSLGAIAGGDAAAVQRALEEGRDHMQRMMRPHTLGTMLVQGVLERVRGLAEKAGRPELELELSRGLRSLEEVSMLSALWDASRGKGDVGGFVAEYGFHGPGESAVTSTVWREDPSLLDPLLEAYARMPDDESPTAAAAGVAESRAHAVAALFEALPAVQRPGARLVLSYADKLWALRETGKATYLHAIDVTRAASRVAGAEMHARGLIADPADVAFLTIDELIAERDRDWREDVAFRRARRDEYMTFEVPQTWTGEPPREPLGAGEGSGGAIDGLAGSPGVAEGPARVVTDLGRAEIQPGEVLVCKTTDPSWATLFLMASAVVIDVGAPSSHGAIISRELGIPCVINTRTGTREIRDGDHVSVDGTAGRVRVLSRSG